jgi:hypothetical protein
MSVLVTVLCYLCQYYCRIGVSVVVVVLVEDERGSCTVEARMVVGNSEREREGNAFDLVVVVDTDMDAAEGIVDMG